MATPITKVILRRLPKTIQSVLYGARCSRATWQCAYDLWLRSDPGPNGRILSCAPGAQNAIIHGALTFLQAADALMQLGLITVLPDVATTKLWQWTVGVVTSRDKPTAVATKPTPAMTQQGRAAPFV